MNPPTTISLTVLYMDGKIPFSAPHSISGYPAAKGWWYIIECNGHRERGVAKSERAAWSKGIGELTTDYWKIVAEIPEDV